MANEEFDYWDEKLMAGWAGSPQACVNDPIPVSVAFDTTISPNSFEGETEKYLENRPGIKANAIIDGFDIIARWTPTGGEMIIGPEVSSYPSKTGIVVLYKRVFLLKPPEEPTQAINYTLLRHDSEGD